MENEKMCEFARLLKESENTVFFGGAGVSTESGMKDYRSKNGLYETVREYGVSPETILSHSFFFSHPETFFDFYYRYFLDVKAAPNRAHLSLAQLEKQGKLQAVITQNIDGLHQKAGSSAVFELHGTVLSNHCTGCGKAFSAETVAACKGKVPYCPDCGKIIKPDVVLYEEPLYEETVEKAICAISSASLLVIGGTSLAVYPAAGYLRYFRGKNIVLINRDETGYDDAATLIFRDSIGLVLETAVAKTKAI